MSADHKAIKAIYHKACTGAVLSAIKCGVDSWEQLPELIAECGIDEFIHLLLDDGTLERASRSDQGSGHRGRARRSVGVHCRREVGMTGSPTPADSWRVWPVAELDATADRCFFIDELGGRLCGHGPSDTSFWQQHPTLFDGVG